MAGHEHSRRHWMKMFCCFEMYPPSFSCSDTGWWGMLLFFMLFLMLLLLLLMSMPSDVSPSLETPLTLVLQDFYTSLRPFRLLLLRYLRMMSWIFGLCSKMLWQVSFASFTWIEKHFISWLRNIKIVFCLWWQMFVLVAVKNQGLSSSGHSYKTWSWITLLLWMFALISSWTWKDQTSNSDYVEYIGL